MGFFESVGKSVTRRVVVHGALGVLTGVTGGLTAPLHVLAEKYHVAADIKDIASAANSIKEKIPVNSNPPEEVFSGKSEKLSFTDNSDNLNRWDNIDPNKKYELPNGEVVYGDKLKEGSYGNVYPSDSDKYNQTPRSEAISKENIKEVS